MISTRHQKRVPWRCTLAAVFCLGVLGTAALAAADDGQRSADADELLRAACTHLAGLKTFSMHADIDNEIITQQGQKLQFSSHAEVLIQRPDRFRISKQSRLADVEFTFDGKQVAIDGKGANVYTQVAAPGTVDGAIRELEMATGLSAPGADLLFSDPYSVLSSGIVASQYLGVDYVHGVACDHLAFREADVDWQLWVQADGDPLPMKYVITSKWVTGAPQYAVVLRDWNTKAQPSRRDFEFSPRAGARRLDELSTNEMGELELAMETK